MSCRKPLLLIIAAVTFATACWSDKGPCDLWRHKLAAGEEAPVAIRELAANRCEAARPLLLARMDDPTLAPAALDALLALGRSPEAEAAVRRGLATPATAGPAAAKVKAWGLSAALPELREALVSPTLDGQREALLDAALAVAPAVELLDPLLALLGSDQPEVVAGALAALAEVDWPARPETERAAAALAALIVRPGPVPDAQVRRAAARLLGELGGAPAAEALAPVAARARAGDDQALLVLWALAPDDAAEAAAARADAPSMLPLAVLVASGRPLPDDDDAVAPRTLAWWGQEASVDRLRARLAASKGVARADAAAALALALPASALDAWEADLRRRASVVLRRVPTRPDVAAAVALTRRCREDPACYAAEVAASVDALTHLDADHAAARAEEAVAHEAATRATAADAARAKALGDEAGSAAARAELAAIAARRKEAFAPVRVAAARAEALEAKALAVALALRRLVGVEGRGDVALRALEACGGEACAPVRAWALAVLARDRRAVSPLAASAAREPGVAVLLARWARGAGAPTDER